VTAPVLERVTAVCAQLAGEGIVVSCSLDGGTVCVHVDSPRPAVGPVEAVTEAHVLHAVGRVAPEMRWVP
jgi:hypothetical protein